MTGFGPGTAEITELPPQLPSFDSFLTLQETPRSGALQKLNMVRNVIIDKCSDEKVRMIVSRLHAQDQRNPLGLARLLEVAR